MTESNDNVWNQVGPQRHLLDMLTRAQSRFVLHGDTRRVFDELLSSLIELTGSEYGFIGEVMVEPSGPYLRTHAITDLAWDEASRAFYEENKESGLEFRNLETLFGHVLITGQTLIANEPHAHPMSTGLPPGHPPLTAFLGLPFFSGNLLIGMIGIANRADGYTDALVDFLQPFLMTCSSLIVAHRTETEYERTLNSLRESEQRGRAILESTGDGIFTVEPDQRIGVCNHAVEVIFGYARGELQGQSIDCLLPVDFRQTHSALVERHEARRGGDVDLRDRDVIGLRKDGSAVHLDITISELPTDSGQMMYVVVARDVTDRRKNEAQLRQLNDELSTRVQELDKLGQDNSILATFGSFLAASSHEAEANQAVSVFGAKLFPEVAGTLYALSGDESARRVAGWNDESTDAAFRRRHCWAVRRGEPHLVRQAQRGLMCRHAHLAADENSICVPVLTQDGAVAMLHVRWTGDLDQTARRLEVLVPAMAERLGASLANIKMRLRLEEDSYRDPLTKLFNRRYLEAWLPREMRGHERDGRQLTVAIVDIDHFKKFNDTYGHEIGDVVLQHVARLFKHSLRADDSVCRLGGEEFLIGLPGTTEDAAFDLLDYLRRALAASEVPTPEGPVSVTVSMGLAVFPIDATSTDDLIRDADKALYRSKAEGRNRVSRAVRSEAVALAG